jgi:hypothetical protein
LTSGNSFSFDLYPGVDAELDAAFARNVGQEPTSQLGATGLAAAVAEQVRSGDTIRTDYPEGYMDAFSEAVNQADTLFVADVHKDGFREFLDSFEGSEREAKIADAYEEMNNLGYEPMVIVGPSDATYTYWEGIFKRLPNTQNGGLYINEEVKQWWISDTLPKPSDEDWFISVVPTTPAPTVNSDHQVNWHNQPAATAIETSALPFSSREDIAKAHVTINEYLTVQAVKLANNESPIDADTYTWLSGTFDNGTKAPYGYWIPDDGRVGLRWYGPSNRSGSIGARPAVRGAEL